MGHRGDPYACEMPSDYQALKKRGARGKDTAGDLARMGWLAAWPKAVYVLRTKPSPSTWAARPRATSIFVFYNRI